MSEKRQRLIPISLRIISAVGAISTIVYFSIVPPPGSNTISESPIAIIPYSYWLHFGSYSVLTVLLGYATARIPRPDWQLWVFVISVGIGTVIELIQYMLPMRTLSILDICVNIIGVGTGILLLTMFDKFTSSPA